MKTKQYVTITADTNDGDYVQWDNMAYILLQILNLLQLLNLKQNI